MYTISPFSAISTRNGGTVPKSGPPGGGGGAPVNCTVMDEDTDYFAVGGGSSGMAHPQQKSVEGWCAANVVLADCCRDSDGRPLLRTAARPAGPKGTGSTSPGPATPAGGECGRRPAADGHKDA